MKTQLRSFIVGLSFFIILFLLAISIQQTEIIGNIENIASISLILLIALMFLAGVLDGFNPCAFSTLLLWLGFLLNNFGNQLDNDKGIREKKKMIMNYATFYSLGIFTIYFLLGTGALMIGDFLKPTSLILVTKILGFVVVVLGLIMLRDALVKRKVALIKMPKFFHPLYNKYSKPTTKAASFFSGIIIGLCSIPCSGAIYMAAILILNKKPLIVKYPTLFIYNLGFILPVVLLAATISNKKLLRSLSQDFIKSKSLIKLLVSIITILLGLISIYMS